MDIDSFRTRVFDFYGEHGRDLPWRDTHEPYPVLVSEVMLQQTQVSRVVPKFETWMETWPDVEDLASASLDDVMPVWQGLGYNNRAKRLRDAARIVVDEHDGAVPRDVDALQDLPGVGPYTARAVLIFAWNEDVVAVDTNIRRIFIHEFDLDEDVSKQTMYNVAQRVLPPGRSREWHNALMDYGALELTPAETGITSEGSQSTFAGSRRYYRGKILQELTRDGSVDIDTLDEDVREAVEGLVEDKIVVVTDGLVSLAE